MENLKLSRLSSEMELLQAIRETWNNRPEQFSDEWLDKFTKLVNNGGKRSVVKDPRRMEPI